MIRFTCPKCYEDSYTATVDDFKPCPYCGCVFSGKYGIEKREEKRVKSKIPFFFQCDGLELQASTMDISDRGIGVEILNFPSIKQNDIIRIVVGGMEIKAVVIWIEKLSDKILAGLKRLN